MEPLLVGQTGTDTRLNAEFGFTLTEVMIAVAILSTLLIIAVPNYLDWNRKYKLKDAVATLHGNIGMSRMYAINQNTTVTMTIAQPSATLPVTVTFRTSAGAYVIPPLTLDSEVSLTNATNATVGAGVDSPQDVQFSSMGLRRDTGNANNLCVSGTGAYTGAACTSNSNQAFNFMNTRGLNYRLVVTSNGKASWCYTSGCAQ
ncbi:MAG: prepilin-type N-terminal cleavage/methylation domain-containing protein [Nitrospirae bacterium]|nr:MAG: prepilin-type N-terminal cleavage/methylation domain-containing protein [Nitrospirota bacterium]